MLLDLPKETVEDIAKSLGVSYDLLVSRVEQLSRLH